MIVSPSLLASDFLNLRSEITELNKIENIWLHLDIMDGHFVPNLTFGHEIIKKICQLSVNPCDAHFMVSNPDFYIDSLKDTGLHNFTFHLETTKNPIEIIKKAKKNFLSVGISIKPGTPVKSLSPEILELVDLVLVMSVEPGFGGQSFMESSLDKITYLKDFKSSQSLNYAIQIDGGINETTGKQVKKAGANNLVAGTFIFKSNSYQKQINKLR
jgi:ribulose-phosphate 3-epimerase